jgi:hypothetical protein
MSIKFLHTADWQLGKPFAGVDDEEIARSFESVAGMYGETQGIVGQTLPRVAMLELPAPQPETLTLASVSP